MQVLVFHILNQKINKYINEIIINYTFPNHKKLISEIPKIKIEYGINFNTDLTIDDILIKSIQLGYKGVRIPILDEYIIKYIDNICHQQIISQMAEHYKYYWYKDDDRYLKYVNIDKLDHVFFYKTHIIKN